MADTSQGDGWWLASDGKWYPPESAAGGRPLPPEGGALGDGAEERGKSPWWKRRWVQITGAVFAALVIIGALSGDPDDEPSADGEAFATTTRSDDGDEPPIETTTSTTTTEAARSTTSTTSTTTTVKADPVAAQTELGLLVAMVVVAGSPVEPYERDSYQPAGWPDSDGDCQNDRHEVLAAESTEPVVYDGSGCFVETGRWIDPYDGTVWTSASEVTIDHVIPLGHAHRVGADRWDDASRQAFAADLGHEGALAVVGAAVNQSKADSSPASWRPPDRAAWCRYGVDWVHGKVRWGLGLESEAERDAIAELLATCDEPDSLPLRADQIEPPAAFAVVIAPVTTPPRPRLSRKAMRRRGSCRVVAATRP